MGIGYVRLCLYCIHTYISAAGEGSSVHWLPAVYKARLEESSKGRKFFFEKYKRDTTNQPGPVFCGRYSLALLLADHSLGGLKKRGGE